MRRWAALALAVAVAVAGCRRARPTPEAAAGPLGALVAASRTGDAAALKRLVEADPGLVHASFEGSLEGPVSTAAANGQIESLRVLAEAGAELRERDMQGQVPLHKAKTAEVATFLLGRGVKPDVRSRDGLTPLMAAAASPEVAEVLLRAGARPNLREAEGRTALHMVVGSGLPSIDGAAMLCAYGADAMIADEKGETARAAAARLATAPNASDGSLAMSRFLAAGGVCDRLREKTGGRGGIDKDVVAAAAHEARCEAGDGWACGRIGLAYEKGKGVAQDLARSARLYERSCERGHEWGCYALGYSLAEGEGVRKDEARALSLFEKACAADYLPSCGQVAFRLERGTGGARRDDARAATLYARSCEGGEAWACWRLGEAYSAGRGVGRDATRALELRDKACKGGEARACAGPKPR